MKANKVLFGLMASGMALAALTQSCATDEPFGNGDGEGTLSMQLVVNSNVTRAQMSEEELKEKCVVYVSNSSGLLYKYQGTASLPDKLPLKFGSYVAEAWTGDSVPASFDSKFFRGYVPFDINDMGVKQVLLECKIANVVVSVDKSSLTPNIISDWQLTVSNSSGSLTFDESTSDDAKGYYMMPKADLALDENGNIRRDGKGWELYTNLKYTLTGRKADGSTFSKSGIIAGKNYPGENIVERAHEYVLSFVYNPSYDEIGGSIVDIVVDDNEIEVPVTIGLYSRPAIKGVGFEIEKQVTGNSGAFPETIVKIAGYNGIKNIQLTYSDEDAEALGLPLKGIDLLAATPEVVEEMKEKGITWDYNPPMRDEKPYVSYVTFSNEYLSSLKDRDEEYDIHFYVVDGYTRNNEATLRLAVGEGAIVEEDPVTLADVSANLLSVRATRATISGTINRDDVEDPVLVYRVYGTQAWTEVEIPSTRAAKGDFEVTLTGLEPGVHYEYAAKTGDIYSPSYEFTTEKKYTIPNGGMEDWSTYRAGLGGNVTFPGTGSTRTFWDSGNEGGSLLSMTMTSPSTTIKHSGNTAAKLETMYKVKLAAGNLFVGQFGSINGTTGAKLQFGRPYEGGSHPDELSVWVKYNPASVTQTSTSAPQLEKGQPDHGQIFIAFSTKPYDLDTSNKIYFNPNDAGILGYGEKSWEGTSCGNGDSLEEIRIPIEWRENAKTATPAYIIIVCSASKYGDYFAGGNGSIMYVDDFELVYNDK